MRRILFVFLDGVGLGPDSAHNPLSSRSWTAFEQLAGGHPWTDALPSIDASDHVVRPLDATLGVDGLPQSGTGQATLFSGVNCAELVGRHFGPYPHSSTHPVLDQNNVFHRVADLSLAGPQPTAFANAYPPRFFEHAERRGRWTVTTRCCRAASVEVRGLDAIRNDAAVPADLTGRAWRETLNLNVRVRTEEAAASTLANIHRHHALTVFEYFRTDKAGHGRSEASADHILGALNRFFSTLLDTLRPEQETLVVTSDHGNLEDGRRTTHTKNPVPLVAYGWAAPFFAEAHDLTDVTPALVEALRGEQSAPTSG